MAEEHLVGNIIENKQILADDFDIPIAEKLESELSLMCNLGKGGEKGIAKDVAQGIDKGVGQT